MRTEKRQGNSFLDTGGHEKYIFLIEKQFNVSEFSLDALVCIYSGLN